MTHLPVKLGSVPLVNPVMTASGTSGHAAELGSYFDLSELGAVVVKSLAPFAHGGNPAPRAQLVTSHQLTIQSGPKGGASTSLRMRSSWAARVPVPQKLRAVTPAQS